jgi:hypothetical protein
MSTLEDARRIAANLPETTIDDTGGAFSVNGKLFAWPWLERLHPKRARVPNRGVLGVRVASEMEKGVLIEMHPDVFFTEPHYDGYPAILIRLEAIDKALLRKLLEDAWRLRAPRRLLRG